jgi:nuclear transcription Y subunit beta
LFISVDSDGGGAAGEHAEGVSSQPSCPLREQDRFLPIANITRIMKRAIPKSGKIAKDARECVQETVSEFVSFITSEASDRCSHEKRKTINGEDVLFAMSTLGFDPYVEPLRLYLQKYREVSLITSLSRKTDETSSNSGVTGTIDYRCDNMRFWLSACNCQVPTPTSQNLAIRTANSDFYRRLTHQLLGRLKFKISNLQIYLPKKANSEKLGLGIGNPCRIVFFFF